jgi:iron uptake system EfeUOB component EfeO/EfeM
MDCNVCHESWQGPKPLRTNCRDCHGTLTDGMLDQWEKLLKDNLQQLSKRILEVKADAEKKPLDSRAKKKLDDAIHNYDFLVKGNGIHNIVYAMKIVQATKNALQEAEAKEKSGSAKPVAFKLSCTGICHVDIADRKVPFGKVTFPHAIHAEGEDSCLKCHSEYAVHGQTRIKGCAECHHGEGMGKVRCQDCHRAEDKMFKGQGVKDVKEMRDWMRGKVTCRQCHVSIKQGKKESIASIKTACAACHGRKYETLVDDWVAQGKNISTQYTEKLAAYEKDVMAIEAKDGRHSVPLRAALDEIRQDMNVILEGNWSHNPQYAEAIVAKISKNIETLDVMVKTKKAGKEIFLSAPRKPAAGAGQTEKR